MEKLILKDGTELEIKDGASISGIEVEVADYTALGTLAGQLSKENLATVQFKSNDQVTGEYSGMVLQNQNFLVTKKTDCLSVIFGLRERTLEEQQQESVAEAISYLTDEQALTVANLYPTFDELVTLKYTAKKRGFRFRDGNNLYKTAQDNIAFQEHYRPEEGTESLYTKINETHAGTLEDPIPAAVNMEYEYGKHYIEDGIIYLCKRAGIENPEEMYGQKITLQYLPSQLVGQYFEMA